MPYNRKLILIISFKGDTHVHEVIKLIDSSRYKVIFLSSDSINTSFSTRNPINTIAIGNVYYNWSDILSIWFRKPLVPIYLNSNYSPHLIEEFNATMVNFCILADQNKVKVINNPMADLLASNKLLMLDKAIKLGFLVPHSLVSNSTSDIKNFIIEQKSITKSLLTKTHNNKIDKSIQQICVIDTTLISNLRNDYVSLSFIQEYISKSAELRVFVIGKSIFTLKSSLRTGITNTANWKTYDSNELIFEKYSISSDLEKKVHKLMSELNLCFAAIDFAVDKNGKIYFLEINSKGQYLYAEKMAKLPLSATMANLLMEHS